MNLLKILDRISDDKFFATESSRLESLSHLTGLGKKAALASIPLGLGSLMATSAKAETTSSNLAPASALTDALQLALTLEYLEDEYYAMGVAKAGLIPAADKVVFTQISKHETAHVKYLKAAITGAGVAPVAKPTFDFTVGGAFDPMNDYQTFMLLAQAFEDTGVRAYKGQAGNVATSGPVLQVALQIHSVEARHASQVRRMRANKGWIELKDGLTPASPVYDSYNGEENLIQAGYNTATLFGDKAGSASFDEILTGAQATAIASLFIV